MIIKGTIREYFHYVTRPDVSLMFPFLISRYFLGMTYSKQINIDDTIPAPETTNVQLLFVISFWLY